jgi:hypothetical protein
VEGDVHDVGMLKAFVADPLDGGHVDFFDLCFCLNSQEQEEAHGEAGLFSHVQFSLKVITFANAQTGYG